MSVEINCRTGNLIRFAVQLTVAAWTTIVQRIGTKPLSVYIVPYSWYNCAAGMFSDIRSEDGLIAITEVLAEGQVNNVQRPTVMLQDSEVPNLPP